MTERIIRSAEYIAAVREVLAERGDDFIYTRFDGASCSYSDDGGTSGSCLHGAALIEKLGLPYNPDWEGATISQILRNQWPIEGVRFEVTPRVERAGFESQKSQDMRVEYGKVRQEFNLIITGRDTQAAALLVVS